MAKEPKRKRLALTRMLEGSLVTVGANQHADIVLFKSAAGDNTAAEPKEKGAMPNDEKLAEQIAKADARISELEKALKVAADEATALKAELAVRDKDLAASKIELEREVAKNADPEEELLKGMSEPARKLFLANKADNEALRKRLAADDDARQVEKLGVEFAGEYPGLPIKAEAAGPIMKGLVGALTEEQTAEVRRLLKAGSDALEEIAKLNGMLSPGNAGGTSAEAEIDKLAKAKAEADGVTYAAAYAKVLTEQPALYAKYEQERTSKAH